MLEVGEDSNFNCLAWVTVQLIKSYKTRRKILTQVISELAVALDDF